MNPVKQKVLVTGASSFVGCHLVRGFSQTSAWEVVPAGSKNSKNYQSHQSRRIEFGGEKNNWAILNLKDEAGIKKFIEKVFENHSKITLNIGISIDAVGKEHDRIRDTPNNYSLLTETIERLKKIQEFFPNLSFKAHTVLSKQNAHRFDEITNEVKRLGPNLHTFDFVRESDCNEGENFHVLCVEEIKKLLPKIHKLNSEYTGYKNLGLHSALVKKVSMKVLDHNYSLYPEFMEKKTQVIACQSPDRNLVLTPYGDIGFCELREWIGNLRDFDYNIKRLLGSEKALTLRKSIFNKECYCFHPCYQTVNILFSKKEFFKAMVRTHL